MKKISWWLIIPIVVFILLLILGLSASFFLNKKWSAIKVLPSDLNNASSSLILNDQFLLYDTPDHHFSFSYPLSWFKISPANVLGGLSQFFKNLPINFQEELMFLALDKNVNQPVVLMLLKKEINTATDKNEIWKDKDLPQDAIKLLSKTEKGNGYLINAQYAVSQNQVFETLEYYCFVDEKEAYELALMTQSEIFKDYKNIFNQIIDSANCK